MNSGAPRATALTPEELAELRARAAREAGRFVDPAILTTRAHSPEWATEILGRPSGARRATWPELYLLHLATLAEPTPPPPSKETAACEAQEEERRRAVAEERARQDATWRELEAALLKAGARVEVRHNYTSHRHLETYRQGGDHVVLLDPLHVGRLHREAGMSLCQTPSNAHNVAVLEAIPDGRLPSCRACLQIARSVARRMA